MRKRRIDSQDVLSYVKDFSRQKYYHYAIPNNNNTDDRRFK